jgi:hypothetical protein
VAHQRVGDGTVSTRWARPDEPRCYPPPIAPKVALLHDRSPRPKGGEVGAYPPRMGYNVVTHLTHRGVSCLTAKETIRPPR